MTSDLLRHHTKAALTGWLPSISAILLKKVTVAGVLTSQFSLHWQR